MVSRSIFRSYDIRGIFGADMATEDAEKLGYVMAGQVKCDVVVGMDMRSSSAQMKKMLASGINRAGFAVHDVGLVPLGVAMFYAWKRAMPLAYVTASHLPREWTGMKFFHADGRGFAEKENDEIRDGFFALNRMADDKSNVNAVDSSAAIREYIAYLTSRLKAKKKMHVALDCGNGMASVVAKRLFGEAGFDVQGIYDVLSETPSRNSEPNIDPLAELRKAKKDVGIAYDGDADRMILADEAGNVLGAEQSSYLILSKLAPTEKGDVVANIECSMSLDNVAQEFSRSVHRQPVGHTFIVDAAHKLKACFGVESAGHYIIPSLLPFDDAMAVSLYAAVALSERNEALSATAARVPRYPFGRFAFDCSDDRKFTVIEKLKRIFPNAEKMDGVLVREAGGWALMRASNTSPMIRLTVESRNEKTFAALKEKFSTALRKAMEESD
ncbi:MAG: hypothetical protein HY365_02415 [Candidatus Aenigmarchaeota archaeon]|nr:hypothetical protein [Candidatus Aenigmarchaeota archaeon]